MTEENKKRKILLKAGKLVLTAELNQTNTAGLIWDALPVESEVNTWGDEIYFSIPVQAKPENAKAVVELGDIGYWPPGKAFCVFFGPTPASRGEEIRPASPVDLIGKVTGDSRVLRQVSDGEKVRIEKA
jgi:hypothetical protein